MKSIHYMYKYLLFALLGQPVVIERAALEFAIIDQHAAGHGFATPVHLPGPGRLHPGIFMKPVLLIRLAVIGGDVGCIQERVVVAGDFQTDEIDGAGVEILANVRQRPVPAVGMQGAFIDVLYQRFVLRIPPRTGLM